MAAEQMLAYGICPKSGSNGQIPEDPSSSTVHSESKIWTSQTPESSCNGILHSNENGRYTSLAATWMNLLASEYIYISSLIYKVKVHRCEIVITIHVSDMGRNARGLPEYCLFLPL
jgi:hypothetical protein